MMRQVGDAAALVNIDLGKESILSVLKDIERDARTDAFLHIDFQEVSARDEANFTIPVHVHGLSIGVKNEDGLIDILAHELHVRCLPTNLPGSIDVDVSALHVGDSIHVKDLPALKGVVFSDDAEMTVIACVGQRTSSEDESAPVVAESVEAEAKSQ